MEWPEVEECRKSRTDPARCLIKVSTRDAVLLHVGSEKSPRIRFLGDIVLDYTFTSLETRVIILGRRYLLTLLGPSKF